MKTLLQTPYKAGNSVITGSPSSFYEPHKVHNMASNYKGLYGIFYKISTKVVKSENIQ